MSSTANRLRHVVNHTATILLGFGEPDVSRPRAEGKWSAKQIVGHLIDSASNNHQRFVRARLEDHLDFPGYEQECWVEEQKYAEAPWDEIVSLWHVYNLHLARVIESTSDEDLSAPRPRHNLHHIAWKTIPEDQSVTLEYFMADYVAHMEHHLRQVLDALGTGWPEGWE